MKGDHQNRPEDGSRLYPFEIIFRKLLGVTPLSVLQVESQPNTAGQCVFLRNDRVSLRNALLIAHRIAFVWAISRPPVPQAKMDFVHVVFRNLMTIQTIRA